MGREPSVVLVTPIAPAESGNGLAMRAGMLLEALSVAAAVHVVVVPVSGPATRTPWLATRARSVTVGEPLEPASARRHTMAQLLDPALRARLATTDPLPRRAALAPPTMADEVIAALPGEARQADAVLVLRLYLAPLGVRIAEHLQASRLVVDVDDDDGDLLRSLGDVEEAEAADRLARTWLVDADVVTAASEDDATSLATRLGLPDVQVIPNAVHVPSRRTSPPGSDRLLFVGNLTYPPNIEAAHLLAEEVLPLVHERRPSATVELVGAHDRSLSGLDGREVHVIGAVPDVTPHYDRADVVVVPVRHGGGTRIKVLEAFAHRRPVVATRAGLAGIAIEHDEAVIADSTTELARGIDRVLADPDEARRMVRRAADLVQRRYTRTVVAPRIRELGLGVSS